MSDMPKNIRQVGEIDALHKIYVEDYVITFVKGLGNEIVNYAAKHQSRENDSSGKREEDDFKIAVLLGKKSVNENDVETFINGLVLVDGFLMNTDESFTSEIWSKVYEGIKNYYEDEEIVGWLYVGYGNDMVSNSKLTKIHSNNFTGKNLLFMVYDISAKEEEFYDYIDNHFLKRKGLYIYYQKNETMHNYMLAINGESHETPDKDEQVVKDIRNILNKHQKNHDIKKIAHYIYTAGMAAAALAIVVGTTVIYNNINRGDKAPGVEEIVDAGNMFGAEAEITQMPDIAAVQNATAMPDIATISDAAGILAETAANDVAGTSGVDSQDDVSVTSNADSQDGISDTSDIVSQNDESDTSDVVSQNDESDTSDIASKNDRADTSDIVSQNDESDTSDEAGQDDAIDTSEATSQNETIGTNDMVSQADASDTGNKDSKDDNADSKNDAKSAAVSAAGYSFYIVKEGDNLGKIAENIYKSVKYADKIKELNNLEDADKIMIGQRLWLPDKE